MLLLLLFSAEISTYCTWLPTKLKAITDTCVFKRKLKSLFIFVSVPFAHTHILLGHWSIVGANTACHWSIVGANTASILLVHGQVTIVFVVFVCLFVCAEFFSAVFDPISIKLGHMLYRIVLTFWLYCRTHQ